MLYVSLEFTQIHADGMIIGSLRLIGIYENKVDFISVLKSDLMKRFGER